MPNTFRPRLSHVGIFVRDVEAQIAFYTAVFGMRVTDRGVGKTFKNELAFLSGAADQHHQLVLSSGRGADAPSTVMQLAFMVDEIEGLRTARDLAQANGASGVFGLNHGNAWSLYFKDPEDNTVEVYLDTPFHCPQPFGAPLDLDQSDADLLAQTEAMARAAPGYMPRADFTSRLAELFNG